MKDSEILREARKLIKSKKSHYICHALQEVGKTYPECYDQTASLKAWVMHMFEYSCTTLATWLMRRGIDIDVDWGEDIHGPIRDLRLRWLDWMIQYCELEEAGWIPWLGGETPPETCSRVLYRDGAKSPINNKNPWVWKHIGDSGDIIAYKP